MATNNIDTPSKRSKLPIRREPHWVNFAKGRSIGYRKIQSGGTWVIKQGRKQSRLGDVTDYTYQEALDKAIAVTKCAESGNPKDALTLHDVLKQYQLKKAAEHGEKASLETLRYFENSLPSSLLSTFAVELTLEVLNQWKHAQVHQPVKSETDSTESLDKIRSSKVSANRRLTILKAALRYVFGGAYVGGWSELKKFPKVNKARDLFLTPEQVTQWLSNIDGAFYDLVKAGSLTGCRVGELRLLTASCFEILNGVGLLNIKLSKTGPRTQRLSNGATTFFKALSEGRDPNDLMLPNEEGAQWSNSQTTNRINVLRDKGVLPADCVMYSLRHYYISRALISGFNAIALARNVGTSISMLEDHYAKFMIDDVYSMLDKVEV
ncbi:hypothetical protein MNBD_GAMMA07-1516 [hydrothermal vent metagenome]|uniref:Tyr recombinase domain-containing protein n=1 Tax=hydrothermal vent metagenome TaxID=652676 RepID=A0A3B0WP27_9ZZZZ